MRRWPIVSAVSAVAVVLLALPSGARAAAGGGPAGAVKEPVAIGSGGAVASMDLDASQAGIDVLKHGGNAIDAAVATASALGVTIPFVAGPGGGGFMVIYLAKTHQVVTIDGRENCPAACTSTMFIDPKTGQPLGYDYASDSLQDIIVRTRRMQGYNTLWLPGTDHAGIATQNAVEKRSREGGQGPPSARPRRVRRSRMAMARDLRRHRILNQLRRLGASCDWSRERFTLDAGLVASGDAKSSSTLYNKELIYRAKRLINWCPRCETALSDLEVDHKDVQGSLWYIRYPLADGIWRNHDRNDAARGVSATPRWRLRHPEDPRYQPDVIGKQVRAAADRSHDPDRRR